MTKKNTGRFTFSKAKLFRKLSLLERWRACVLEAAPSEVFYCMLQKRTSRKKTVKLVHMIWSVSDKHRQTLIPISN